MADIGEKTGFVLAAHGMPCDFFQNCRSKSVDTGAGYSRCAEDLHFRQWEPAIRRKISLIGRSQCMALSAGSQQFSIFRRDFLCAIEHHERSEERRVGKEG